MSVCDLLASVPLSADGLLNKFGTVITIDSKSSIVSAYQTLLEHQILSAPVWDETDQQYVGMLDLRDLVSFAVHSYEEEYKTWVKAKKEHSGSFDKKNCEHKEPDTPAGKISSLIAESAQISTDQDNNEKWPLKEFFTAVKERQIRAQEALAMNVEEHKSRKELSLLVNLSMRNSFQSVKSSDTLLHVAEILASGAHAVPVMDASNTITNIITQSTMINFLVINKSKELETFMKQPVGDLGSSPVVAVGHKSTVYSVLKVLDDRYISGVAIVDTDCNNKLIGTFSSSDLRGWFQTGKLSFEALTQSVTTFLKNRTMIPAPNQEDNLFIKRAKANMPKKERPKVISCIETNTIGELVNLFHTYKVHRVYVTHPLKESVQSVVCLKDLLRKVAATSHLNEEAKKADKLHVCSCHHCKGKYSYTKQSTVENHIHKYGSYTPWWSYQLFGMVPFPIAIPSSLPSKVQTQARVS